MSVFRQEHKGTFGEKCSLSRSDSLWREAAENIRKEIFLELVEALSLALAIPLNATWKCLGKEGRLLSFGWDGAVSEREHCDECSQISVWASLKTERGKGV